MAGRWRMELLGVLASVGLWLAAAPADAQVRGGTLRIGMDADNTTMDPHLSTAAVDRQVYNNVYGKLFDIDVKFGIVPQLVQSWEVKSSGLLYVFKLRRGVKFHDGTDFNADIVKWNFDRMRDPALASPRRSEIAPVKDVKVVDPYTVEILLSAPFAMLFLAFTTPPMFGYLATTQHALYFPARGLSPQEASIMLAVGGVLSASGRMLAGVAADRLGAAPTGFLSFSLSLLGMACLFAFEAWPLRVLAYGYVLFLFLPLGSRATIFSVLVSRITPPAHYGVIFGILGIGNNLGAAAGPWLSGALYDRTGPTGRSTSGRPASASSVWPR